MKNSHKQFKCSQRIGVGIIKVITPCEVDGVCVCVCVCVCVYFTSVRRT
jgi:hypothetical protein